MIVGAAASIALMSACSRTDPAPAVRTAFIRPPVSAIGVKPCARPVKLPDRDIDLVEATKFWGADRTALIICEERRRAALGGQNVQ